MRRSSNEALVQLLVELVEANPELRFSQILDVYGFVKGTRPANPQVGIDWTNEFYLEPNKLLDRVQKRIKDLQE